MLIPAGEVFSSLDKGILDAVAFPRDGHVAFKIGEVAPFFNMMPLWSLHQSFVMNLEKWNSLPKDVKKAITSVSGKKGSEWVTNMWYGEGYDSAWKAELARLEKEGFNPVVYKSTPEQVEEIRKKAALPVWNQWVEKMKAKGIDGQAILDEVLRYAKSE